MGPTWSAGGERQFGNNNILLPSPRASDPDMDVDTPPSQNPTNHQITVAPDTTEKPPLRIAGGQRCMIQNIRNCQPAPVMGPSLSGGGGPQLGNTYPLLHPPGASDPSIDIDTPPSPLTMMID